LVAQPGSCIRRLAGRRARQIKFSRFLRNASVTTGEMAVTAGAATAGRVAGREVVAIQDTSELALGGRRARANGFGPVCKGGAVRGLLLHPVLAVDAASGALIGLVHVKVWNRQGRAKPRRRRATADKESQRWIEGAARAGEVLRQAAQITVVADRESDIYQQFAERPANVDLIVRACQNRRIQAEGEDAAPARLFAFIDGLPEQGRFAVNIPAAPGRPARVAELALRFAPVMLRKPRHGAAAELPDTVGVNFVDVREMSAPQGGEPVPLAASDHACGHNPWPSAPDDRSLSPTLDHRGVLPHTQDGRLRHRGCRYRRSPRHDELRGRRGHRRRHGEATGVRARGNHGRAPGRGLRPRRPTDSRGRSRSGSKAKRRGRKIHIKEDPLPSPPGSSPVSAAGTVTTAAPAHA